MKKSTQALPSIVLLSGGTGRTAEQVMTSALAQFHGVDIELKRHTKIRSKAKAVGIVRDAAAEGSLICHSLVEPKIRQAVQTEVRKLGVPCIDALGPSLALLSDHLQRMPRGKAGLLYDVHREQIDRMDAMDFTLAHDDGARITGLKDADVVLVGASRTSKSVTCFYLAFRGLRAGNVPMIPDQPLPVELTRLNPRRVIGLTMNAAHLEYIRQHRLDRISKLPVARYANLRDIQSELRQIRERMAKHHWECIDVSYKATEEVADRIVEMLPRRRARAM
tara:strand:- start:105878 stop:106711 length:834 start_codon:yes stop_codon:yes gene_type:complete